MSPSPLDPKALRWRCRLGLRELDVLLLDFLDHQFADLALPEQHAFSELLQQPAPDVLTWVLGQAQPANPTFTSLVQKIRKRDAS